MATAFQVADYYSKILRRGRLEEVAFKETDLFITASRQQLRTGTLCARDTAMLFGNQPELPEPDTENCESPATAVEDPENRQDPEQLGAEQQIGGSGTALNVVLSLVTLVSKSHGSGGQHHGLLLMAAKLFPDGRLVPELSAGSSPWIPAQRLESPLMSGLPVMAGSLEDYWKYSRLEITKEISQAPDLSQAIDVATTLFERVAGQELDAYVEAQRLRDQQVETEMCWVQPLNRINAVSGLLDVYDFLSRQQKVPPLVQRLVAGWEQNRVPEQGIHEGTGLLRAAQRSCGSMSDSFPLTDSQRRAVHAHLMESEGEITAVSGPPGTGKTTMLQSIVANLITRRALDEQAPPVIVGSSTNNQAVTNVISSFASVTKQEPGSLDYRWLPLENDGSADPDRALQSLAVYCPSQAKLDESKRHYLVEQAGKGHTYSAYMSPDYLAEAKDRFVLSAHEYFQQVNDLPALQQMIHDALTQLDRYRIELLDSMHHGGRSEEYLDLCQLVQASPHLRSISRIEKLQQCQDLKQLDELLDITLRYAQFWLAVHYFEAQWLLVDDPIEPADRFKTTSSIMERYWWQAAALTPCFVMTLYQVPKYFKLYERPGEPSRFDTGRIDLLIVDEAGQVDTPLALPALALAQRAVIVGDENQLSPVWSTDELTDAEVASSSGIPDDAWENDLQVRGITCSAPSSLMRAAAHASAWSYGENKPGLFLSEHFRCHPQIIEFCNDLIYDGLLEARRAAGASRLNDVSPAFLFVKVPQSQDTRKGSSRQNEAEAKVIAEWIVENYARFLDLYHHQVPEVNDRVAEGELIGVVTPFSAQAHLISNELEKAAKASSDPDLPPQLWKLVTVGTAHKLQGAERPIILFSAVYGQDSAQSGFIDANPQLMNVAVSRAKDLLIVFAANNRWRKGPVFETLADHAVLSDANFDHLVAPRTHLQNPEPAEEALPVSSAPVALSSVISSWRQAGYLHAEDEDLKATALNQRLAAAGVLEGAPGAWQPSTLARLLGVVTEERSNKDGGSYLWTGYTQSMQDLLRELYLAGKI